MSDCKIYLAPMQGVTEAPFRNFFERDFGGVNAFYTPFIRWEHGGVRRKDIRDITPGNNMVPVLIPQVLAGSADEGESILGQILPLGYKEVDFNMGCAYPMVAKKGKGSGILDKPDAVRDLLSLAEKYPEIHFSVKMRLGYQNVDDCMSLLPVLNAVPLSRVVVHARSGMQQYNGDCDRVAFERFAIECKHPVVYNGEMLNTDEWNVLHAKCPNVEGMMWGRGLLAAPWLASEFRDGRIWNDDEKRQTLRKFHDALFEHYIAQMEGGEKQVLMKMKTIWEYFLPDADRKARKKIHKAQRLSAYSEAVSQLLGSLFRT